MSAPPSNPGGSRTLAARDYLLIFACALPVWFFFIYRGEAARAFVAALAVCVVGGVGAILSNYRNRSAYWLVLGALAFAHAIFVMLVPLPQDQRGPGIVFAPLVIADMYACAKLVLWAAKRTG